MKRRNFLKSAALGSLAAGFQTHRLMCSEASASTLTYGFISGILKNEMTTNWRKALKNAASFGYRELETGQPPEGISASEFLKFCNSVDLKILAGGIRMTDDTDALRRQLDELKKLEIETTVCYWPWNVSAPFSLENCKWSAPKLNVIGSICADYGLSFCWHNHNHEFTAMEEGLPFDYLMNHTDPDLVKVELDVYWAAKGGIDPVQVMQEYAGRFRILHLKDMTSGPDQDFACVGSGILDFPGILEEARAQNIRHLIVEKDNATDGLQCLQSAMHYFKTIQI